MNRRRFLGGMTTTAVVGVTGCLGGGASGAGVSPQTDEKHISELRTEIKDRGVDVSDLSLAEDTVEVEHSYDDDPNDAIANVAMAFVERIAENWDIERLDGHLNDEGNDWTWHAEAEWAQAYADGEIGPDEYGSRLSETMAMVTEEEA
jgi:hypothetical protein